MCLLLRSSYFFALCLKGASLIHRMRPETPQCNMSTTEQSVWDFICWTVKTIFQHTLILWLYTRGSVQDDCYRVLVMISLLYLSGSQHTVWIPMEVASSFQGVPKLQYGHIFYAVFMKMCIIEVAKHHKLLYEWSRPNLGDSLCPVPNPEGVNWSWCHQLRIVK